MNFAIGHPQRERIEFKRIEYECRQYDNEYDANWLTCTVSVAAGTFEGSVPVQILANEVSKFYHECRALYESLEGCAEFKTIEDQVHVLIKGDGLGHMECTGHLMDQASGDGNRLSFVIRLDQTLLRHTVSELADVVAERPVRPV